MAELRERLQRLLEERGLTPHAAAVAAGVDASNLYRLLSGKRPRPSNDTVTRLAVVLGVPVDDLTGRAEATAPVAASAHRLARLAVALADMDLEGHLRTLASLSAAGRSDCVAYTRWRAQREQAVPTPPREFALEEPEPAGMRVLGERPAPPARRQNAS